MYTKQSTPSACKILYKINIKGITAENATQFHEQIIALISYIKRKAYNNSQIEALLKEIKLNDDSIQSFITAYNTTVPKCVEELFISHKLLALDYRIAHQISSSNLQQIEASYIIFSIITDNGNGHESISQVQFTLPQFIVSLLDRILRLTFKKHALNYINN